MRIESMKPDEIKEAHPSICYGCENARRSASEANEKAGYVGCALRVMTKNGLSLLDGNGTSYDHDEIGSAKEIATGWVDLRSKPFGKKSGMITNEQLLTLEVGSCHKFEPMP